MNRTYAIVWNPSLATWSVASEHARRRGKGSGAVLAAALLLPALAFGAELPTGGQVVSGSGQIGTPANNQLVINQSSGKLAIDWQSFDIGAGNKVTFNQPGTDAIALNRVLSADGSKIMGQLDANGQVFIVNPNGVLFGQNAQVNVGGLVASTLDISNSDFEAGNYQFKGDGTNASVINQGQIRASDGGAVALLGGTVSNKGVIVANQGNVALAAGNAMTLDFAGDGLLNVQVDEATVDALVENHQLIKADGGQVLLTANAGDALLKTVVNNTGVIEAQTLGEKNGKIVLLGDFDGGTVQVAGTLDASAATGGDGGFIETSGAHVQINDNTRVTTLAAQGKTGEWLIDPTDFTVSAGKAPLSDSGIGADILSANLNSTSVTLQTVATDNGTEKGDIHLNSEVIWDQGTTLTLSAHNSIYINADITAEHSNGKLALLYGQRAGDEYGFISGADYFINAQVNLQSGQNFSTKVGLDGSIYGPAVIYNVVNDAAALQAMGNNLSGNYALGSHIDLRSITNWQPVGNNTRDSEGQKSSTFTGKLNGLGHTLSNLTINRGAEDYVGLFGVLSGAEIRHVGLEDVSVTGGSYVGGLVGEQTNTTIRSSHVTGSVSGTNYVGGLVGSNFGSLNKVYADVRVSGTDYVGGLVGSSPGLISIAYASGNVSGTNRVGGLVGDSSGNLSNVYATGSVSGTDYVGGLVGSATQSLSKITYAYASGAVTGTSNVGGLVGYKAVTTIGGSPIVNITSSFWDTDTTGQTSSSGGGAGKTTAELRQVSTYTGWDLSGTWGMPTDNGGYLFHSLPILQGITPKAGYQYFDAGAGTADNPWIVSTWQQLQNINRIETGGKHFALSVSLDQDSVGYNSLASATANAGAGWVPLGPIDFSYSGFAGYFDGQGHTISDLVINRSNSNSVGLFSGLSYGSSIRNIGVVGGSISGNSKVGGLVGAVTSGSITNAYSTATVSGNSMVGGLVGHNIGGAISEAHASGRVVGGNQVGGLVGHNDVGHSNINGGLISNVYASGSVSGGNQVGGLIGSHNNTRILNAYATGTVSGADDVGGLIGFTYIGLFNNVYATGNVSGNNHVGGLVGQAAHGTVNTAYATGNVTGSAASSNQVGGLIGWSDESTLSDVHATGIVSGTQWVGGLTGYNYGGSITNAYALGSVTGEESRIGGLTGYSYGAAISNVYALGRVEGTSSIGGLIGHHEYGTLSNAYAMGNISGSYYVGGLLGYNLSDSIRNAYATGNVSGNNAIGGLVGFHIGRISNTYATGSTSGTSYVGGLVGESQQGSQDITNSFYATTDKQGNSINAHAATAHNGSGKTWAELSQASTFAGWNIASTGGTNADWRIYEGYTGPLLRNFLQKITVSVNEGGISGKTYDGHAASGTADYTSDILNAVLNGSLSYSTNNKNAGTYSKAQGTLALGGLYSGQQGYDISYADLNAALTIDRQSVTLSGILASDKTYDGTTFANLNTSQASFNGLISGDSLTIGSANGVFDSKNAGANKTVTISGITLGGASAGNYNLINNTATSSANINTLALTLSGILASDKTYDGTTVANLNTSQASFNGLISGDSLNIGSATGVFDNKNAGANKTVTISGITLSGADAGNYHLLGDTTATANINTLALTLSGILARDKTYDSTTFANLNTSQVSFAGLISGDSLYISSASGVFDNKNAGANKTVTISGITLSGADAGNYHLLNNSASTTANINTKALTLSGILASDKTYDGTTFADLYTAQASFNGLISGDSLNIGSVTGVFDNKNAGANKTVTISGITLSGADAGNYHLLGDTTTTASINTLALTLSGILARDKTYDSTTFANLNTSQASFNGLISGDNLNIGSATGVFDNKNVGANKTVTVSGITLGGADASNYHLLNNSASTTANINTKALTLSGILASNKTYDGTTLANLNTAQASFNGLVSGDNLNIGSATGAFDNKNAGANKTVTVSGITLGGTDAGNYHLLGDTTATASINTLALTLSGILASDKTYDGTTVANLNNSQASFNGLISGDILNIGSATGVFDNKNVGANKTVTVSGITLGGADAGNYHLLNNTATSSANINTKALTLSGILASDKTYDGTTATNLNTSQVSFAGLISGDSLNISSASGVFDNKNAGANKTVTVSGITLGGADAGNYHLLNNTATSSANINTKALTLNGILASDKTYDGTTFANLNTAQASFAGLIGGDNLNIGSATGVFDNKNAGANKTVTVRGITLSGADAGNYHLLGDTTATASINSKALTLSGILASDKTYDGTTLANLNTAQASFNGLISGDNLNIGSANGVFDNKNAGANKTVTVSGITLGGADAGNYHLLNNTATSSANINTKALTLNGILASNKTYDGSTAASLNTTQASFNGLISGDSLSISSANGVFDNKNAGTNKTVTVSGITLGGADAGNYRLLNNSTSTTANINKAALSIRANDASKLFGQNIRLSGYSTSGLLGSDSISALILTSEGQPTNAEAGNYAIVASNAVGTDLSNYAISYENGTLQVKTAPVEQSTGNDSPSYISILASNNQTGSNEAQLEAQEPQFLNQNMPSSDPLNDLFDEDDLSQGMRLPEGI